MTTLNTRQTFALVALFVVTSLAFIQLDNRRALDPIKDAMYTVVSPAVNAFGRVGRGGGSGNPALGRELAAVKAERDQLAAENARLRADVREVEQLRLQAKLQQDRPTWKMLQARVLGSDPTGQHLFLTIDKGREDGIEVGLAVVAQGPNYIGQVTEVEERTARVMLVIDASQTVGARLDSGPNGVIYGLSRRGGWLELRYVSPDTQPAPGELVLTTENAALRTAGVPGGLIVGRVDKLISSDQQADSQTVHVIPLVNFDTLQVVTVVLTDGA